MHPNSGKKYAAGATGPAEWHDLSHIWLPYAQMKTAGAPLPVVATRGSRFIKKCVAPILIFSVPKGCSTVSRR